ncbi:MAG: hypothetical protein ACRBCS_05060 [Cellvibrionaceae bacterium]
MTKILIIVMTLIFSDAAYSTCTAPEPPTIPNPETTVTAEMVKAQNDVKAFLSAAESFLKCTKNSTRHNKMVDKMKDVGDSFNKTVKAYKTRMANA